MVPPVRARAASDRGFDDSADTIPIARANSSPSIIQVPTQTQITWCDRDSPPELEGSRQKNTKKSVSDTPPPNLGGKSAHPLDLGGLGLQLGGKGVEIVL